MMDLIIAILIALGCLESRDRFTPEFERENAAAIQRATEIYERGEYRVVESTGGVVVIVGVGV
jgi:hypothetical protein